VAAAHWGSLEVILREGTPNDILAVIDAVLLCEAWVDLAIPIELRSAWEQAVGLALAGSDTPPAGIPSCLEM